MKVTVKFLPVLALVLFVALWALLSRGYSAELWPNPAAVITALGGLVDDGVLAEHILASLARMLGGFAIAAAIALPAGILLGTFVRGFTTIDPLLQVLRPISPVAWFPLAVLWFGVGDRPAVFIIAFATFFPLFLTTASAVRAVPRNYLRVAANFGASQVFLFGSVVLPAATPQILVGVRVGLGIAWVNLVAGEMLGAQSGLGYLIVDARNSLRTDRIVAVMLLIGLLGFALDRFMALVTKSARAWSLS